MNEFDRYQRVLKGQSPDIVPRTPILMQFAAEYIGSNYGAFASDYRILVEANERCALDFGMEQVSCISDPYRETHGFGGKVEYIKDGVPRCTPPLSDSKNLSLLSKPDPHHSERMLDRVKAAEEYTKRLNHRYSVLGWIEGPAAEAADLRGTTNFLMDLIDDERYVSDLMDICVDVAISFAEAQIYAGCDTMGIGDAIASQVSPDLYERLIQPREKKLVHAIQRMGATVKLHICGNITHLLPGIADIGTDILDVDHLVDITHVRDVVGEEVVITGNIDPVSGLAQGKPDQIREEILNIYESVGNPYMVNAGCEIPSGTPIENLKALCKPIDYKTL